MTPAWPLIKIPLLSTFEGHGSIRPATAPDQTKHVLSSRDEMYGISTLSRTFRRINNLHFALKKSKMTSNSFFSKDCRRLPCPAMLLTMPFNNVLGNNHVQQCLV